MEQNTRTLMKTITIHFLIKV